jgi:hypothetical protein
MLADWTVPFNLTSALYSGSPLPLNQYIANTGYYFLRQEGCALRNNVRSQKNDIPQADGAILHRRFTAGMEMDLAIQLWETTDQMACDALQQSMLDTLMGYLYALINAGDNEGRISWTPNGQAARMLDDIRLLTYPAVTTLSDSLGIEVAVTVDCALPYEEDLQATPSAFTSGTLNVTNTGNRPAYPVFRIYSGSFIMENTSTGHYLVFDDTQPGCPDVNPGDYIEFNTLNNTAYKNGNQANMKPGIVMVSSDFFLLAPGVNTITLDNWTSSTIEHNNAWC